MIVIKRITENDVINQLSINNPSIRYIGGFIGSNKKATFQCIICGEIFRQIAYYVYSGKCGCKKCNNNKGVNNVKKRLEINNPTIEYVDGYTDPHKKATFRCKLCGHVWMSTAYEVYTGNSHCPNCSPSPYLLSEEDIKERLNKNNPTIEYVGGYTGSLNKAIFRCEKCGYIWETIAFSVYLGKTGCPKCAFSKGEDRIARYLESKNIDYKSGWTFEDCKNIYLLPFDFYLPNKNTCIEYDGEFHFLPVIRSKSTTIEQAKENLKKVQFRDNIKNNYCKNNNINILRIPYTEFNNIEQILDSYFGYNITL